LLNEKAVRWALLFYNWINALLPLNNALRQAQPYNLYLQR
jgi:hypothetical protein